MSVSTNSVFHSEGMYPFGFHSERFSAKDESRGVAGCMFNIATWIPVIGTIIGVLRIVATVGDERMSSAMKRANLARGVIETLSLGALFMIPDLIVTIGRALNPHPTSTWGIQALEQKV